MSQKPVIVAGFLTAGSGLGESARLCHQALQRNGVPVLGIDLTQRFRQGACPLSFGFEDGSRHRGPATLILHVNAPFVPLALCWIGRGALRDKHVVGYWAWELPVAPREWRAGLPFVHRILAPSSFTADALRSLSPRHPVEVLAHPVAIDMPPQPPAQRNQGPFTVLVSFNMASGFERKNPMAAVAAFLLAFGDDPTARLVIKVLDADAYPAGAARLREAARQHPNIVLDQSLLDRTEMLSLYASCDVLLSLHRSEGFGLVLAEAMLAGLPVVATGWSGNADFLTPDCGFPVAWRLVPARDPQGEYDQPGTQWADPDIEAAAGMLKRLRSQPDLGARVAGRAAAMARDAFSAEAYAGRLSELLGW